MATDKLIEPAKKPPLPELSQEQLRRMMSPERRALSEAVSALRKKIGPMNFDVVKAIREMREDV
jgi:hypothetical protein